MTDSSGAKANWNGKMFEDFVHDHLVRNGWTFIENRYLSNLDITKGKKSIAHSKYELFDDDRVGERWFTTQCKLTDTIYNNSWKVDFLLHDERMKKSLVIECKWQQSSGTVDEKYPYLVRNIKEKSPYPCLVLLDGDGYKPAAKEWLKSEVDKKLIGVLSMSEFVKWFGSKENFFN